MVRTRTPGIFKRGNRYVAVVRDARGRQRKLSAATLAEAKERRAEYVADVARGEHRATSRTTFAEYAPRWAVTYRGRTQRGVGPATMADYRRALGVTSDGGLVVDEKGRATGAVGFFGRMLLAEIGAPELRAFADHVAKGGRAHNTVRLHLAPVKALLATAHEDGLIRSNPAAGLRNLLPADVDREHDLVKAFTPEELARVLAAIPEGSRGFFEFLAETGLRIGEAIEVRWSDIDLGGRWLHVRRRWFRGAVGLPKGRKTRRIRLSQRTARVLWQANARARPDADDLVFSSSRGARIDASNLMSRVLKPAAVDAGIGAWVEGPRGRRADSWVGFHTCRHTCATMLFRNGWNAKQVQRYLGHSDAGFTLRTYVHLLDEDVPEPAVLELLPDVTSGDSDGDQDDSAVSAVEESVAV